MWSLCLSVIPFWIDKKFKNKIWKNSLNSWNFYLNLSNIYSMQSVSTLLEWTPFSKTCLPHWRSSFSDPNELLNLSLWLDLLQRGHFLYFQIFWNSYFYFFSVCFHFQTWDVFMKLKNNTKNFRLKIFINKKSSDLAQNLRAVRAPEGLTAHKISAKSDDILLTEIFKWNFGISWTVTCLFFLLFRKLRN